VTPPVTPRIKTFVANYQGTARFTDQQFLRVVLWPTVRQSILNHDGLFGFHGARPFPAHPPVRWKTDHFHVGSNAGYSAIAGQSARPDGAHQVIELAGAESPAIHYEAPVHQGHWKLNVPFFVADAIQSGKTRVVAR
jgi:hypothetical protein